MNAAYDLLKELEVEVLLISTDTKFSHKRFVETEPLLKDLKIKLGADPTGEITRKFGVLIEDQGIALRGRFLIDPEGTILAEEILAPPVGRSVKELIRQVIAFQNHAKTGEACPANWKPGKKTLPVNKEAEKMTGKVGELVSLEELVEEKDRKEMKEMVEKFKSL